MLLAQHYCSSREIHRVREKKKKEGIKMHLKSDSCNYSLITTE